MARSLNGSSDYLRAPFDASYNPALITVAARVKLSAQVSTSYYAVGSSRDGNFTGWTLYKTSISDGNTWAFWAGDGAAWTKAQGGATPSAGVWAHVVGQYDGSKAKLYVDGVATATGTGSYVVNSVRELRVGVGANEGSPTFFMPGLLAHFAIWRRVLSDSEIVALYNGVSPARLGAAHYWPFDSGASAAVDWGRMPRTFLDPIGTTPSFDSAPRARLMRPSWQQRPSGLTVVLRTATPLRIASGFIAAATTMYTPAVAATGSAQLTPPLIAAATSMYTPALNEGLATDPGFIAAATTLYTPTVSGSGSVSEVVPFISPAAAMYTPTLRGNQALTMPTIPAGTVLYQPEASEPGPGRIPGRFFVGYPWRFLLVDLADWSVLHDLETLAYDKAGSLLLNASSVFSGKVPANDPRVYLVHTDGEPYLGEGVRALIGLRREGGAPRWKPRFAGRIMQVQDDGDDQAGAAATTYTAFDEWKYLYTQPIRKADGSRPDQNGLSYTATPGSTIALELLQQAIANDGPVYIDADTGTIEATAALDISFQPAISVGAAWDQLVATGSLDIVLTPIWDPVNRPGKLVQLNIYAQAGVQKDGVVFAWGQPPYSARQMTRLEDGTVRANTVALYSRDPQHPVTVQTDTPSKSKYGSYWLQDIETEQTQDAATIAIAQERLRLLKAGRTTVTVSPFPQRSKIPFLDYDRGDRVRLLAPHTRFRKAVDGFARIYGIPVTIGDDRIETIDQLLTSPDGVT